MGKLSSYVGMYRITVGLGCVAYVEGELARTSLLLTPAEKGLVRTNIDYPRVEIMLSRHRLFSRVVVSLLTGFFVMVLVVGCLIFPPAASAQTPDADPNFGSRELYEGFVPDPFSLSFTAGGITQSVAAGCGYGYISEEPDFALTYSTSGFSGLYFYVEGEGDTTLLIRTPSGRWLCNDDGHGNSNPIVGIPNAAQGEYQVWAGAYNSGYIEATLYVSERDPAEATSPPPVTDPHLADGLEATEDPNYSSWGPIFDIVRENSARIRENNARAASVSEACPDGLRTVQDPLSEAPNLACTDLAGADLAGAELHGANLSGANLIGTDLTEADLYRADLTGADLTGANLGSAELHFADLTGADLFDANLRNADLMGADLTGANLIGTDLSGVNLSFGGFSRAVLDEATYNSATQFPPNFDPAAEGMILNE